MKRWLRRRGLLRPGLPIAWHLARTTAACARGCSPVATYVRELDCWRQTCLRCGALLAVAEATR